MKVVIVAGVYNTPNVNIGLLRLQSVDFFFAQLSLFLKKKKISNYSLQKARHCKYSAFRDYQFYSIN